MNSRDPMKIDRGRIPRSLFISGLAVVPAWLIFVVVHTYMFHPPLNLSEFYDARTIKVQSVVIPVLLVLVTGFVCTYGGLVYWLLLKTRMLSYPALLAGSLLPAFFGTIIMRDNTVFFPLLYFCFWHSSISWFYVRLK